MHRTSTLAVAAIAAIAACTFAAPASAQVVTTAGGEVASPAQKNLIDRLITGDSIEVATATLAAGKTQNAAVKAYATMIATDHSAHIANLQKIAAKKDVGREANPADSSSAQLASEFASLQAMPAGPEFDKAFLQAEVSRHQAAIAALDAGKAAATDEDLKKDIVATSAALQSHAAKANEVAASLNKAPMPPAAPAKPPR
jgi:putative membrane protein